MDELQNETVWSFFELEGTQVLYKSLVKWVHVAILTTADDRYLSILLIRKAKYFFRVYAVCLEEKCKNWMRKALRGYAPYHNFIVRYAGDIKKLIKIMSCNLKWSWAKFLVGISAICGICPKHLSGTSIWLKFAHVWTGVRQKIKFLVWGLDNLLDVSYVAVRHQWMISQIHQTKTSVLCSFKVQ